MVFFFIIVICMCALPRSGTVILSSLGKDSRVVSRLFQTAEPSDLKGNSELGRESIKEQGIQTDSICPVIYCIPYLGRGGGKKGKTALVCATLRAGALAHILHTVRGVEP